MGTAIVVAGMLASGFFGLFVFVIGLSRATRKGYQAGTISLVMVGGFSGGFFLAIAGDHAVLYPLFTLLLPALLLLMLPRRKPRRIFTVQRVTFPYHTIGQAVFVIGCVVTAILSPLSWWTGGPWWLAVFILVCGLSIAWMLKSIFTSILKQPERGVASFADVIAADPRPPVILMRAFEREGQAFVVGELSKYGQYARGVRYPKQPNALISLDEYLRPAIERRIGPFLALGNPQDYYTPAGAVRAYFKDETWMDEFRELAQRAGCLLLEASESSNLRWELQHLRQCSLHDRVVVVAKHPTKPYESSWSPLAAHMAGVPPVSWDRFAATLKELGYEVPSSEPETGSVIGFDSEARAHVLTSDADLPDEFVEPIEAWLDSHRDPGRCGEVACTKCGRMVFKRSDTPAATFLCGICRAGSPVIRAAFAVFRWTVALLAVPAFTGVLLVPVFLGWPGWIIYPWAALVLIGGMVLWHVASTVARRLEDTLATRTV
jgi:hypothetical protein